MANLNTILSETMLHAAASLGTIQDTIPGKFGPADSNAASRTEDKAIWRFNYTPGQYKKITGVTCRVRHMGYMEMSVCESIDWGPIAATHDGTRYALELTDTYKIVSEYLPEGEIRASSSGLWQLHAKIDRSIQHVFGYEIPLNASGIVPISDAVLGSPTFMPDGSGETGDASAAAGQVCTLVVSPLRIVVVVSLVCCKERSDFEPAGALVAGRLYPTIMVMANLPLDRIEADIALARPATTPHTDMDDEKMLPQLAGSFFADRNEGGIPAFWDFFFSHYLIDPPAGSYVMVDPALPARTIVGAVEACGGQFMQTIDAWGTPMSILHNIPAQDSPFYKMAQQGEFDNLHIAPRMIAPASVLAQNVGDPTFLSIAMAPFCVHDCLHTHWRWSSANGAKQSLGWDGMQPYAKAGAPLVPPNQKIMVQLTAPNAFRYHAEVRAPIPAAQWQVINHHGSAYALEVNPLGKAAKLGQVANLSYGGESPFLGEGSSWAMFYWHLRYRYDLAGKQERIKVTDLAKARS